MTVSRCGILLLFWLCGGSALAASYVFPGSMPGGCSGIGGVYSCPALTLAWGDSISIAGTKPATITVNGNFNVQNALINNGGSVSDLTLIVTGNFVCNQCQVSGNLTVGGQTNLVFKGLIGGSLNASGAVLVGTSSEIGGDISAAGQSMTVQSFARVNGDVTVGSLSDTGTSTYYGGSITATTGSVTLSNASVVVGNVTTQDKDETITLASSLARVGGCLTVNSNKGGTINLGWQASVGGVCCSPGNSGCKDGCVSNNSGASMPGLCTATPEPTAGGFSAIDEAYSSTVQNFLSGHIYTKLAGTPFKLKVAALNNSQIQTTYAAAGTKNVAVKLVDNSDGACGTDADRATACTNSACNGKPAVAGGSQTLAFTSADKGVKTSGDFTINSAYANLVAVLSEGSVTACSVDTFAVRPTKFTALSSSASNATLNGAPKLKAGSDSFTLAVTANAGGYSGTPQINPAAMSANGAGWVVGALAPAIFPSAVPGASTSVASGSFTYSEVGNFRFLGHDPASDTTSPRGIYDDSWVAVDSAATKNDCLAGSYANTKDAAGKYGCLFGLHDSGAAAPNSALFGRFVPDRFVYLGGEVSEFCASGSQPFSYMGQPALGIAYRLQAVNGAGVVTANYSQAIGYPVANPALVAEDQALAHQGCDLAGRLGGLAAAQWSSGIYNLNDADADNLPDSQTAVFSRPASPLALTAATCAANRANAGGPFWLLDIGVTMSDSDAGAALTGPDMNAATSGVCSGSGCTARKIGATGVVYGRLALNNAYGSEMLPLPVPAAAQLWTAAGWLKNVDDSCSALTQPTRQDTGNGGLLFYAPPDTARNALAPGEAIAQMNGSTAATVALANGDAKLLLRGAASATVGPGTGNFGYVDVIGNRLSSSVWLPPTGNARACFGACGPRSPVIYFRERF